MTEDVGGQVDRLDWAGLTAEINDLGLAQTAGVLGEGECHRIAGWYDQDERFRSTVDMARHRYGEGQYRYFSDPLPHPVAALRAAFCARLLPIARDWADKLGRPAPWPDDFEEWLDRCHHAGQTRPTALVLRYHAGDWNALHRDLYGELVFPLQVVIGLDRPGEDHTGGEFLMVEQRPRAQSRGHASVLQQGSAIVFTTRDRPVRSARGWSAAPMRHGVSTVRSGTRCTLGLVLHDAA